MTALVGTAAYCLNIPAAWKQKGKHDIFYKAHLSPHHGPVFNSTIAKPEIIDGEEVFEVEHILDSKKVGHSVQYLIKWHHYDHMDNTWEPAANMNA